MNPAVRVGVACFVWKNGKFLIAKRQGSHGAATWSVPGGHLEFDETWEDCARREVLEETGLQIKNIRFLAATNDIFKEGKHYATVWMESDWAGGEPAILEPDRCSAQNWCTFSTLPAPLFEPCWQNLRQAKPELFS